MKPIINLTTGKVITFPRSRKAKRDLEKLHRKNPHMTLTEETGRNAKNARKELKKLWIDSINEFKKIFK